VGELVIPPSGHTRAQIRQNQPPFRSSILVLLRCTYKYRFRSAAVLVEEKQSERSLGSSQARRRRQVDEVVTLQRSILG
jgi:hypothetical protein